jgi:hypothetical protein
MNVSKNLTNLVVKDRSVSELILLDGISPTKLSPEHTSCSNVQGVSFKNSGKLLSLLVGSFTAGENYFNNKVMQKLKILIIIK